VFEFIQALHDPGIPFLRYALLAGLLASVSFGVVGTYVVTRKISYIAGAISHSMLGGIGVALYVQTVVGWTWCTPMLGAVGSALLAAVVIGLVSLRGQQREDTVIGALWATGMAIGLLFLAKTPGYFDPMSVLFGNILLISKHDLWLVSALDILVAGLALLFHNKLLGICFDEEFTELRGVNAGGYYLLLICLTALTVALLVRVVGIVLVIALLTLPAAVAGYFARRIRQMMVLSIVFCMLFTVTGLAYSYVFNLPSGPSIIMFAGGAYLVVTIVSRFVKWFAHD